MKKGIHSSEKVKCKVVGMKKKGYFKQKIIEKLSVRIQYDL
ncbi:hypothetical protein [Bacillus cereus]|nr:hypothetical protein [Bacillus cereus]MCU5691054.1 hypothetical protein [Bacillus cereus]